MQRRPYFPALDGLRALAVMAVFFHHYTAQFLPRGLRYGWVGVDVFFVLSGFLITGILYDSRQTQCRWRDFYVRRTLRIFPLFYGILLLTAITTPLLHWSWSWRWLSLPTYLFNVMPHTVPGHPTEMFGTLTGIIRGRTYVTLVFFHFWTLCVEEQFYLLWPAVVFLVSDRRKLLQVISIVIVLVVVLRCVLFFAFPTALDHFLLVRATYARADSLMMGSALALLLRGPAAERVMQWGGRLLAIGLCSLLLLGVVSVRIIHQPFSSEPETSWLLTLGFTCISVAAAGLLLLSLQTDTVWTTLLRRKSLRWLGQRSYGFYVLHMIWIQPTMIFGQKVAAHFHRSDDSGSPTVVALQTLVALLLTLTASAASYRWLEKPFLRMKDRLTHRPPAGATQRILQQEQMLHVEEVSEA